MGFKFGIIGLPNVGKSTLFNALTKSSVQTANFPFCTIEPHTSIVMIPDLRLNKLSEIVKPKYTLPAAITFIDIAGLVKDASKGKGLGNQFLTHIRRTDAIGHVVRCFKKDNIIHVTGKVNPLLDINIVNTELILFDINICERAIFYLDKKKIGNKKNIKKELEVLKKCLCQLEKSRMLRSINLNEEEKEMIRHLQFLTIKPTMYIANIDEENNFKKNTYFNQVQDLAEKEDSIVVPICAIIEEDIAKLAYKERYEFIQKLLNREESNLDYIIRAGFMLLNLQTYFTINTKEVHAWTIPIGSTALQAAGKIHSDFKKGFICAQTISYEDFISCRGSQGAKKAGKIRSEGKNYIIKDGDIINFLFNI